MIRLSYDPVVVINPEGTLVKMTIAEAIEKINEQSQIHARRYLDNIKLTEKADKDRQKQKNYYAKLRADPVRWKEHCEKKRLSRISKVKG